MMDQNSRFKPWLASAMLVSVLLLGGCIRFGPQADEMENTVQKTEATQEESVNLADSQSSTETTPSEDQATNSEDQAAETEGKADGAETEEESALLNEEAEDKKDGEQIEVTVNRDDAERIVEFDLHLLPDGYSLSAMSWEPIVENSEDETELPIDPNLPSQTPPVEGEDSANSVPDPPLNEELERISMTYSEAIMAGQAGTDGFFIDREGQRIGYRYAADQTGRAGTVRLDFRDGEGGIATWEAQITLGLAEPVDEEVDNSAE